MSPRITPTRFDRRMLLRGTLAVSAFTVFPTWRSYAGEAVSSTGQAVMLSDGDIADLQKSIKGNIILPSSPEYEEARKCWSAGVNNRPALIAKVTSVDDIKAAVQFARKHNLLTAVKCGGHSYAGYSMADKGLTIDLGPFNGVEVDKTKKIAYVAGGALLGNLDRATVPLGLVTTAGVVSHTGVGGLATGLGQGRLSRKFGYTIDNIVGVEVLTADGQLVRANAKENADMYWAVRGGSGNFGIVTKFELQLHDFESPNITTFSFTYPIAKGKDVMKTYLELCAKAPNDMGMSCRIGTGDNGETTVGISGSYVGTPEAAEKIIGAAIAKLGDPTRKRFEAVDYVKVQSVGDGPVHTNRTPYYRSGFFDKLDEKMADAAVDKAMKSPKPHTSVSFTQQGGISNKLPTTATAYSQRSVTQQVSSESDWTDPKDADEQRKHADDVWSVIGPMTNGGYYINYVSEQNDADLKRNFKGNYERLVDVKTKYDPTNFFHLNANIKPHGDSKRASLK